MVIEKSRSKLGLTRIELLGQIKANDLISIANDRYLVHIVFPSTNNICRPILLKGGKERRDNRKWDLLGSVRDYADYRRAVQELGRTVCSHCLRWYR